MEANKHTNHPKHPATLLLEGFLPSDTVSQIKSLNDILV
jgi:hypothetical protein